MPKPKPNVLLSKLLSTGKREEVIRSSSLFAVYYKGGPVNLRTVNQLNYPGPKYKKVCFPNPGHALNLAKKLNELFKTTDFEVYELHGQKYQP